MLDRIDRHNRTVNAYCHVDAEGALKSARESEARWLAGAPTGMLDGVPIGIKDNILVTVSGVFAAEPLRCAVDALGRDRVMFAADYPFEDAVEAGRFMDTVPIEESLRADVAYKNAARLLGL